MFAFMKHHSTGDGREQPLLKLFRHGPIYKTAKFKFLILWPFVEIICQFCWHKLGTEI